MYSAQNTLLPDQPFAGELQQPKVNTYDNLWNYHKLGCINNIKVRQEDKYLNIDTQQQLYRAFQPKGTVVVWTGWISPDHLQDVKAYQNIKQKQANGECFIQQHQLQYCSSNNAFLAIVTYTEVQFALKDRYSFYKQDLNNG